MRAYILAIVFILVAGMVAVVPVNAANNFPSPSPTVQQQRPPTVRPGQQKPFYGYIPPAPIRHTWPGGYRAIFNEITNTLIEHIMGWY